MPEKIKEFINHKIATAPTIFWKVLAAYNKEEATEHDIIIMLTQDTRLADQILKVANLPVFVYKTPVNSLSAAIKILGLTRVLNIAIGMAVMELFPADKPLADKLWRHSYEVALVGLSTGNSLKVQDSLVFLTGLLHDIGKQALFNNDHSPYQGNFNSKDLLKCEQYVFGCTHPEVGAWFAEAVNLPESVVSTIKHHHTSALDIQHTPLTQVVVTAQALSKLFTSDFDVDEGKVSLFSSDHLMHLSKTVGDARGHAYNFFNKSLASSNKLITKEEADILLAQLI